MVAIFRRASPLTSLQQRLDLSFTLTPSHSTMSSLGDSNHIHDAGRAVSNVDVDSPQIQTVFPQTEDADQLMAIEKGPLNDDGEIVDLLKDSDRSVRKAGAEAMSKLSEQGM